MKVLPIEGTTMSVLELAELAQHEAVILTRDGLPVVAVRDVSGSDWESASLASNARFQELINKSRRNYQDQGGISIDQLRTELGLESESDNAGTEP
jgi:hypothetical protein